MRRFALHRPSSVVGLEMTPSHIKLVQLNQLKHRFQVEKALIIDLPQGVILKDNIQQPKKVIQLLQKAVEDYAISAPAVISLPMNQVVCKKIPGKMPLRSSVVQENMTHYLKAESHDFCYDFVYLANKKQQNNTLLVAAKQSYLQEMMTMTTLSGLNVKIVDVDLFALLRLLKLVCAIKQFPPLTILLHVKKSGYFAVGLYHDDIVDYQEITDQPILYATLLQMLQTISHTYQTEETCDFYVIGEEEKLHHVAEGLKKQFVSSIKVIHLAHYFELSAVATAEMSLSTLSHMLISLGLAIRRMPLW